ncbi:hypothetical protein [Flammeovirga kamogawensis]|uniref:Uncharacterized protein n=1 Tax=Flammeovirga kamogawensis TaxID=373891 RepID=A0ABX8H3T9_9BACT|nr:hypothetical protein [Flammeovirga kamogawensis]MBB6460291.1 hypothetical protein [Flammeovirga kamogawensis]QWG10101.1 hypothetical protein KM029_20680 [Flammeovirga kamogawensis]
MKKGINGWETKWCERLAEYDTEFIIADHEVEKKSEEILIRFLESAEKYNVLKILPEGAKSESYLSYIKRVRPESLEFDENSIRKFAFYNEEIGTPATRLAFYNKKGEIEEKDIYVFWNYGEGIEYVTHKIKNGDVEFKRVGGNDYDLVPPIKFSCGPYRRNDQWFFYIGIFLISDIWLPLVRNLKINITENDFDFLGEVDNRPLAYRHTPRLNSFLRDTKQISDENNGKWHFHSDGYAIQHVTDMRKTEDEDSDKIWCDHGIPLDGKIVYQEDIESGRIKIPSFD